MSQRYIKTHRRRHGVMIWLTYVEQYLLLVSVYLVRASVSQTHVSRCPIILRQRARDEARRIHRGFFSQYHRRLAVALYEEKKKREREKKKETPGRPKETKTYGEGPRSIHGGVRGRALSTYLPTYRMLPRLLGPPTTFKTG